MWCRDSLRSAMDETQLLWSEMDALRTERAPDWRKRFVAARRRQQILHQQIADAADACFRQGYAREIEPEFRRAINLLRSTIALHQATWPVVSIDLDDPAYKEAVSAATVHSQALVDAVEHIIASGAADQARGAATGRSAG